MAGHIGLTGPFRLDGEYPNAAPWLAVSVVECQIPEDRPTMPTYQYACTNATCGNRFELVQAFTDPSVTECPVCGQPVRKVYGSVGVVFKGSGFYRTDSRAEKTAANGQKSSDRERTKADPGSSEPS